MKTRYLSLMTMIFFFALALVPDWTAAAGHGGHDSHGKAASGAEQADADRVHTTSGVIETVDKDKKRLTITHEAVSALNWPAMTMRFGLEDPALLDDVQPGDKLRFDFREQGQEYIIVDLEIIN
jgi:Cu(I)/Ag(I) efflux system protein CusF